MSDELVNSPDWLEEGFLTTVDAAMQLRGTIPLDIRQWCRAGFIRYVKEPCSGKYLVSETDIHALATYCDGRSPSKTEVRAWWEARKSKQ